MADTYKIDKDGSQFNILVTAEGLLSRFGHSPTIAVRDFDGEVRFDPAKPEESSLSMTINVDSLEVTSTDVSEKDRREIERNMKEDVLHAKAHSTVHYETSRVQATKVTEGWYRLDLNGKLELRGVSRNQPLSAQLRMSNGELKGSGEFKLKQSHYGIKQYKAVGGTLKVKDEVKLSFDIVARKERGDADAA